MDNIGSPKCWKTSFNLKSSASKEEWKSPLSSTRPLIRISRQVGSPLGRGFGTLWVGSSFVLISSREFFLKLFIRNFNYFLSIQRIQLSFGCENIILVPNTTDPETPSDSAHHSDIILRETSTWAAMIPNTTIVTSNSRRVLILHHFLTGSTLGRRPRCFVCHFTGNYLKSLSQQYWIEQIRPHRLVKLNADVEDFFK